MNKVYLDKARWPQHVFSISLAFFIKACGGRLDEKFLWSGKQKIMNIEFAYGSLNCEAQLHILGTNCPNKIHSRGYP